MQYLRIANPGVAPVEGFTVFGVSTTRLAGASQTIGEKGSGSKHGITLLLRNDILPEVYAGTLKMEFFTKPLPVNDGLMEHTYSQVWVKYGGTDSDGKQRSATKDLSFTLDHASFDWTEVAMALREFVSNALDRTFRETGKFDEVVVDVVDKPRAIRGGKHTAVFIPLTPDVQKFYRELPKRFLHFQEADKLGQKVLLKAGRNLTEGRETTMVYKKGVFVREFAQDELPSLYDYNLDDLRLDESRNVDDYAIKSAVSRVMADATVETLIPVFKSLLAGDKTFEAGLDSYYLKDQWASEEVKKNRKEQWSKAWDAVVGSEGVAVSDKPNLANMVSKKGYKPAVIKSEAWFSALEANGIQTDTKVLTDAEKKGKTTGPATPDMEEAVNRVWNVLESFSMLNGRSKPPVFSFTEIMEGESYRLGYYSPSEKAVYLHTELSGGQSHMILQTALEEVVHHVTGAGDMSRDLQDYLFRLVVKMAL
jgi:hypothetical protein